MATWEQWWKSFKIHAGFFKISIYLMSSKFIPSAELKKRQILPVWVIVVELLGCNSHDGVDGGVTVAFVNEVKRCHCFFPLYCLKLAKDIFN